jgi:HD-like signal output (HDOD) protein
LIAVTLMVIGIGLVSTLAAAVAAHFVKTDSQPQHMAVETRLARMEALLQMLVEQAEPKANRGTRVRRR